MKSSIGYIVAAIAGWFVAQVIKNILNAPQLSRTKGMRKYMSSGEMPSAHTATVVALCGAIYFTEGLTDLFAVAGVFTAVTVYDALVARRSIGEQGTALLRLLQTSPFSKDPLPRIALGHKPLEVIAGGILGLVIGYIVALFITI